MSIPRERPLPGHPPLKSDAPGETCVLFADGLRFDVGVMLQEKLEARELLGRQMDLSAAGTGSDGDGDGEAPR